MSAPKLNVADVAGLARLSLTPEETTKFTAQLSQILAHMETLGQIATLFGYYKSRQRKYRPT